MNSYLASNLDDDRPLFTFALPDDTEVFRVGIDILELKFTSAFSTDVIVEDDVWFSHEEVSSSCYYLELKL